jgi:hypothetical protein
LQYAPAPDEPATIAPQALPGAIDAPHVLTRGVTAVPATMSWTVIVVAGGRGVIGFVPAFTIQQEK